MQPIHEAQEPTSDSANTSTHNSTTHEAHKHHAERVPRWAAVIGALAIGLLYLALPEPLTFGPNWLLLVIEAVLLLPLVFSWITHRPLPHITIRLLTLATLGAVTLGLAASIALLIMNLPTNKQANVLLRSAALLWGANVLVFALWYWEIDGGGPHKRRLSGHKAADLMFPQQADGNSTGWAPTFFDYLFVAFTGATALSPSDTFPLTPRAKMLMMVEAIISMTVIVLLAGRAVNILGS